MHDHPSPRAPLDGTPTVQIGAHATRIVRFGGVAIGGTLAVVIAGPCAVADRAGTLKVAEAVRAAGAHVLRGGAFKPRTSPRSFQGLGMEGVRILAEARERTGLPFVTEVMDPRQVEDVGRVADAIQIGSRSMQNFPLLREVGRADKPVLLKRGFGNSVEEWIGAAEYVAAEGNLDIVLCERGIRTFADGPYSRSTLDLAAVRAARQRTPFPVIVDPSHAAGRADRVPGLACAGLACGAQGIIVEVVAHAADRQTVPCDGPQAITPATLAELVRCAPGLTALSDRIERVSRSDACPQIPVQMSSPPVQDLRTSAPGEAAPSRQGVCDLVAP